MWFTRHKKLKDQSDSDPIDAVKMTQKRVVNRIDKKIMNRLSEYHVTYPSDCLRNVFEPEDKDGTLLYDKLLENYSYIPYSIDKLSTGKYMLKIQRPENVKERTPDVITGIIFPRESCNVKFINETNEYPIDCNTIQCNIPYHFMFKSNYLKELCFEFEYNGKENPDVKFTYGLWSNEYRHYINSSHHENYTPRYTMRIAFNINKHYFQANMCGGEVLILPLGEVAGKTVLIIQNKIRDKYLECKETE